LGSPPEIVRFQVHSGLARRTIRKSARSDTLAEVQANRAERPDSRPAYGDTLEEVETGTPMLIVGYPLGFHDTLHHLPVARHAINASPLSFRFEGMGYFLTDARTHRGTSGACLVMSSRDRELDLPQTLLGIYSARLDVGTRDLQVDEALGLNCAWFADVLNPLASD
jgi:hypothetical protein